MVWNWNFSENLQDYFLKRVCSHTHSQALCANVGAYKPQHACKGQRITSDLVWTESLVHHWCPRLAGPWASGEGSCINLSSLRRHNEMTVSGSVGSKDPNSGPHPCTASVLHTEPSLQPPKVTPLRNDLRKAPSPVASHGRPWVHGSYHCLCCPEASTRII